jgi:hypothetical protein
VPRFGESFVEKVSDVRRRATVDGKAAAPGESLKFLAGGPKEETGSTVTTECHRTEGGIGKTQQGRTSSSSQKCTLPKKKTGSEDDEWWWYRGRSIIWCRECRKCGVRKEHGGFKQQEWNKEQLAMCAECDKGEGVDLGVKRASSWKTREVRKRVKNSPNPQAKRPRTAHGKGVAVRDVTSESEEDETERVEWGARKYGVRMSPAHPWYVGRGYDTCGGEVVQVVHKSVH